MRRLSQKRRNSGRHSDRLIQFLRDVRTASAGEPETESVRIVSDAEKRGRSRKNSGTRRIKEMRTNREGKGVGKED